MTSETSTRPQILPLGQDGLLVRFGLQPDPSAMAAAQAFHAAADQADLPGVSELAPSLVSVYLRFDPARTGRAALHQALEALLSTRNWTEATAPSPSRRWHIPVAFGGAFGPQLPEAARLAGLSEAGAIQELTSTDLRVLTIGFAPGQPYIGLLPERWNLPRLDKLTPQVPAGALVVAVRQLVLFANPSPTGWRQVGETAFRPFRPDTQDPFPLSSGDGLRLHAVSAAEFEALREAPAGGARCEVMA